MYVCDECIDGRDVEAFTIGVLTPRKCEVCETETLDIKVLSISEADRLQAQRRGNRMKLNRDNFKNIEDQQTRTMAVQQELAQFAPDDPPYLSDIYVNLDDGGQAALVGLEQQYATNRANPFVWKILVRRDEWGNVPAPGEKVVRRIPKNRKWVQNNEAKYTSSAQLNSAKVDGSYSDTFEEVREFEVDDKGCISCTFDDAGYFLFNWGVHHKTGRGMCSKPEYSTEPVAAPNGNKLHVHYWRYSEVDVDDYQQLPQREKKTRKKRGVKNETNPNTGGDNVSS